MRLFDKFIGKRLYDVEQELQESIKRNGYQLNIMDPEINNSNIVVQHDRMNVMVEGGVIKWIKPG
jgi:hypothetical protein